VQNIGNENCHAVECWRKEQNLARYAKDDNATIRTTYGRFGRSGSNVVLVPIGQQLVRGVIGDQCRQTRRIQDEDI